ncbi:unnamed protein product [Cuscuta epithymum]|uniref:Exocyst subunit Exo70 family protein n=1 Tax=Cuscuta epithymum TaxID=186058 RepID=A0AAV0E1P2_9ASTE|nr:unnamed protein product [Cuscuta epithymum]
MHNDDVMDDTQIECHNQIIANEENAITSHDDDDDDQQEYKNVLPPDLLRISQDIDRYIFDLQSSTEPSCKMSVPDVPICVEQFTVLVEEMVDEKDGCGVKWSELDEAAADSFLQSTNRLSKLSKVLLHFSSEYKYAYSISRVGGILQRLMSYIEHAFQSYLDDYKMCPPDSSPGGDHHHQLDEPSASIENKEEVVEEGMLKKLGKAMMLGAYEAECWHAYFASRQMMVDESLRRLGFEKWTVEEVHRMGWEGLEREIVAWLRTFKYCSTNLLLSERKLSTSIFEDYPSMSDNITRELSRFTLTQLLDFSHAVTATSKRVPDDQRRLYKLLDMYEALRDLLLPARLEDEQVKAEALLTQCRLGELAIAMVHELLVEHMITMNSATKNPPPAGGGIHPLTRTAMGTIERMCAYKDTLEQVFAQKQQQQSLVAAADANNNYDDFKVQIVKAIEVIESNLEAKSKQYKDPSLSLIFLMNNGRYVMQKVRGSEGMSSLMAGSGSGGSWIRKKSAELRQYHKKYQRDTWGRLLQYLGGEGLTAGSNGKVNKPALKERFKSFNATFDEIYKAQSSWVISDEQLQSELRVSICNMVVPAYRSFIARFSHTFTPGRQTQKYVKYQGEDLEKYIDQLFDGTATKKK